MKKLLLAAALILLTIPAYARHSDRINGVQVFSYIPRTQCEQPRVRCEPREQQRTRECAPQQYRERREECRPRVEREYTHRHSNNDYYYRSREYYDNDYRPHYFRPHDYYEDTYYYTRRPCEHYYTPPVVVVELYEDSKVCGFFGGFGYHMCYKLQNGSVFRQTQDYTYDYEAEYPIVRIYRSDNGVYYMRVGECDFKVRVERVE